MTNPMQWPANSFDSAAFTMSRRHCKKVHGDCTEREHFPSELNIYGMSIMSQGFNRYFSHLILPKTCKIVIWYYSAIGETKSKLIFKTS